jgi:hypothetical protein
MTTKVKVKKCGCETSIMKVMSEPNDAGKSKLLDTMVSTSVCAKHRFEALLEKWDGHRVIVHGKKYGKVVGISQQEGMRRFITDKDYAIPYAIYLNYLALNKEDSNGNLAVKTKIEGADASKRFVGPRAPSRRKRRYPN